MANGDCRDYVKDYPQEKYERDLRLMKLTEERGVNPFDLDNSDDKAEILENFYAGLKVSGGNLVPISELVQYDPSRICMAFRNEFESAGRRINGLYSGKRRIVKKSTIVRRSPLIKMILDELDNHERQQALKKVKDMRNSLGKQTDLFD